MFFHGGYLSILEANTGKLVFLVLKTGPFPQECHCSLLMDSHHFSVPTKLVSVY